MIGARALSWRVSADPLEAAWLRDHGQRLHYGRLLQRFAGLALRKPSLVPQLLGAAWRFRARDWYRRPPFLPVPPLEYIAWRLHTAYGDEDALPPAHDLARYLTWSATIRRRSH